jgi:hypothetical protein
MPERRSNLGDGDAARDLHRRVAVTKIVRMPVHDPRGLAGARHHAVHIPAPGFRKKSDDLEPLVG